MTTLWAAVRTDQSVNPFVEMSSFCWVNIIILPSKCHFYMNTHTQTQIHTHTDAAVSADWHSISALSKERGCGHWPELTCGSLFTLLLKARGCLPPESWRPAHHQRPSLSGPPTPLAASFTHPAGGGCVETFAFFFHLNPTPPFYSSPPPPWGGLSVPPPIL